MQVCLVNRNTYFNSNAMQACCEMRIIQRVENCYTFIRIIVVINLDNYKDERVLHSNVDNFILKHLSFTLQLLFYTRSNTSK
jgi:hypothetical protein